MNDELLKLIKKAGIPAVSAAAALFGYRFIFPSDRPRWVGLLIVAALGGIVVGVFFARRLLLRRTDSRKEGAQAEGDRADAQAGVKALQMKWNQAIEFLRGSHLKKRGDPLYVLPWYMVIGEPGSGKTTAVQSARLASFGELKQGYGSPESGNCDWSFFEQAIVLDAAGRYLAAVPPERDRQEWQKLLDLLFKYRKKEPLNGLVITVPADTLLAQSVEALQNAGQTMRKRIDELMRALGAKFPVYVLVTKCDLVPGMAGFCEHLSAEGAAQPMGCINQNLTASAAAFISTAFYALGQRLKSLRLVVAHHPGQSRLDAESISFPDAFLRLEKGVAAFTRGAFQENLYQETPLFRGLFFSAAGLAGPGSGGFFLHEFFSRILPADREFFTPTKRALEWRKGTMNMGVAAWLIVAAAVGGLMTYSFARNLNLLRDADRQFSRLPPLQGDLASDILAMDRLNQAILSLSKSGDAGWLPTFGLHETARVQKALQEKLSVWFRNELLVPFDQQNGKAMAALNTRSPDIPFSQFIEHLVGRIQLIEARLGGDRLGAAETLSPPPIPTLKVAGREAGGDIKAKFSALYFSSVFWVPGITELRRELPSLQTQLKRLLALKGSAPQWLIAWAKSQNARPPVTLKDYWGGDSYSSNEPSVQAIFSRKDKKTIDSFLAEIESALDDPQSYSDLKSQFERWYRANAFDAWRRFVNDFPHGVRRLRSRDQWRQAAVRMPKDEGPYFALLNNVTSELEPLAGTDAPLWVKQLYQFHAFKGAQGRASLAKRGLETIGVERDNAHTLAAALTDYRKALQKVVATVSDAAGILPAVALTFQEGSGPGSSPFAAAFNAQARLKAALAVDDRADPAVWKVIAGPLDFLWEYARRETADRLQIEWEKNVLAEASGIAGNEAAYALLAQDGPAIKFAKDQAAPFVSWKPGRGYHANEAFGGAVPFSWGFFAFLNSGSKVSKVMRMTSTNVMVTALGAESNAGASRAPSTTRLELKCGKKTHALANRRQRLVDKSFSAATRSFAWTSECDDTALEIGVGGAQLRKLYAGPHGFFDFLKDFEGGTHVFSAGDFPEQAGALSQMGIQSLTVRFNIKGSAPQAIPSFTASSPVPTRIVQGWVQ